MLQQLVTRTPQLVCAQGLDAHCCVLISPLSGQPRPLRSMVVELGTEFLQTAKAEILDLSKVQFSTTAVPTLGEGGTEEQESQEVVFY